MSKTVYKCQKTCYNIGRIKLGGNKKCFMNILIMF